MTIVKRNRLVRALSERIAVLDGRSAYADHTDQATEVHSELCCEFVREDAERNTYEHLVSRKVYRSPSGRAYLPRGVPALQRMLCSYAR